jgi:zinc protease
VVVVGDFDPDEMEAKVRKTMADIPAVANPVPKEMVAIPGNDAPMVGIATDPETTGTTVRMYIKHEPVPVPLRDRVPIEQVKVARLMISMMANQRMQEISQKPSAPFVAAGIGQGALTETCDVVAATARARDGQAAQAFEALYTEVERIRRHGFTYGELERAQSDLMRSCRQAYDNRDDRRSEEFVQVYLNNFMNNDPMPTAEFEWVMDSTIIANMNIGMINQLCERLFTPQNQVVTLAAPAKDEAPVPSQQDMLDIMGKVGVAEIAAYTDDVVKEPLITAELRPGKVTKTETDKLGDTVWTLANGIKVVIRKTDFKADELLMSVNMQRGLSILSDAEYPSGEMLSSIVALSGVGKFNATQLDKQLSGLAARVSPSISSYENGFSGSCSPKDLETMLQLLHLYFTQPRFDQNDFDVTIDKYASALENAGNNPSYLLGKRLNNTLYGNNIRRQSISVERLVLANLEMAEAAYRKLYVNPVGFNYVFVGNIDLETAKPLIEKYIGSFPPVRIASPKWKDDKVAVVKGKVDDRFAVPMQAPMTSVYTIYSGQMPYTMETSMELSILRQVLDIRYMESIREEKGGTYGVRVSPSQQDVPVPGYRLTIYFDTDPAMADELMAIIPAEIEKIAKDGPLAEDMAKIKEFMVKQRQDNLKRNGVWLNYVDSYYVNKIDRTTGYEAALDAVTPAKIKALAAKILADGNVTRVVMDPAK